jgi:hypothetical protein
MFFYKVSENANFEKVWSILLKIKIGKIQLFLAICLHAISSFVGGAHQALTQVSLVAAKVFVFFYTKTKICV